MRPGKLYESEGAEQPGESPRQSARGFPFGAVLPFDGAVSGNGKELMDAPRGVDSMEILVLTHAPDKTPPGYGRDFGAAHGVSGIKAIR